jgi:CubicO group peptidase (beta-lactamase class C family)
MKQFFILSLTTIITTVSTAQQLTKQDELFIDSIMTKFYKPTDPGAVLLIAKHGVPILRKAYGMANLQLSFPNKPEYVFRIGSMTKQFTAVCMLKLAQEGKLNLQDDIKKYLPGYNSHGRYISIENLLTHTSGIIDAQNKPDFVKKMRAAQSHDDLMQSFMNDSLLFEPGTDWHYSNSNYELAGFIIEKVSGIHLKDYMRENIFQPLEMTHTYVDNEDSVFTNLVNGYDKIAGNFRPAVFLSYCWEYAAGDILSSVDDLLKWDNALYTEKIIKKEWLEKAWKPFILKNGESTYYGFAWINKVFNGMEIIEHSGGINGFNSDGIRIPSQQLYIAILSNTTSAWSPAIASPIALQISKQSLPKPLIPQPGKKILADYTGVYALQHAGGNSSIDTSNGLLYTQIILKDDTLFAKPPLYGKVALSAVGKDLFVTSYANPYYQFHRNDKGKIISAELYNMPIQGGPAEVRIKTDLPLPKEKKAITLNAKQLEQFKGKYDFGGGAVAPVIVEGNTIYLQMEEKFELFAEDETHFFFSAFEGTAEFIKQDGKVVSIKVTRGATFEGKKVE